MYACISYTLSACGLYVRIRHILYTKYYPYMYFPNICTTQPSKAYHILTPLVSPLPRFKEHHKAMTFQSGVTKRTWPVGSSAETRCGRIPTTWNLLSNVCGPKLWTTPPQKKKKLAISAENSWNYHTLQNFNQNCWFDKFTNLQNRIHKDRSGTPPFGPTNWHLTQWILQVAQPSTAVFHQYGVQGLLITAVRRSLDGECSFPKNKKQMCDFETI